MIQNGWKLVTVFGLSLLVVGALVYVGKLESLYLVALLVAGVPGFLTNALAKKADGSSSSTPAINVAVHLPGTAPVVATSIATPAETPDAKKGDASS